MNLSTLKIKRLSLAEESRIIRRYKRSLVRQVRRRIGAGKDAGWARDVIPELHRHRVLDVRSASRVSHLAHNFIKGTPYQKVEAFSYDHGLTAFMGDLSVQVAKEVGSFGWPEMKNMPKADREKAVASWMNL